MSKARKETDEELMQLLRSGDSSGLDGLFRRYYDSLCRLSLRIIKDADSAEDVVQEFFLSVWKKRNVLPEIDLVAPYLKRSVRNRSLNFLRDQKRIPTGEESELPVLATTKEWASEKIELEELRERVDLAINSLPERCRLIFVLHKFGGMKQKEIAVALNISVKTVENQMGRAYQHLRSLLSAILLFGVIGGG
ncbi:RNA polymerase sigma-70 factor [Lewinellaceae bacterium SD302]|nr:RNA polymerase sigma-70 factor [Lewinellaceae bacterium SD302]